MSIRFSVKITQVGTLALRQFHVEIGGCLVFEYRVSGDQDRASI